MRIIANTEQFYDGLVATLRELRTLPEWMTWKTQEGKSYLYEKRPSSTEAKYIGVKNTETEKIYADFQASKEEMTQRIRSMEERLNSSLAQYRALHLPQIMSLPAKILRELDLTRNLGSNLMVVGTNAFAAYEIEARERFARGLDETEDFDLGWCRGSGISFLGASTDRAVGSPLFSAIRKVDKTFKINPEKPYQAINSKLYEVELLTAPSVMPTLSKDEVFSTAAIPEQEWLLLGRPVRHVVCARDGTPAPLFVPDPRYMGLHKIWLSKKETRRADKKDKDARQGELLLSAVARKMQSAYPMNIDFVLELPEELVDVFNGWAERNKFVPENDTPAKWF